jgi:hypothetical protein
MMAWLVTAVLRLGYQLFWQARMNMIYIYGQKQNQIGGPK